MRTKLSKRILSVLLAALMVVTSVPLMAFTAFADSTTDAITDENVVAAQNAMDAFADKLAAEGAAYGNVTPAYNAFVNVQKAIDAYYYGGADVSTLNQAVEALNTASSQMTDFTGYTVDNSALSSQIWAGDSTNNYTDYYKNVLWIDSGYSPSFVDSDEPGVNCDYVMIPGKTITTALAYPTAVLLYDGVNTPATSVMAVAQGNGSDTGGLIDYYERYTYSIALTAGEGLSLLRNWQSGEGTTLDHIWNMNTNNIALSNLSTGFNGTSAIRVADRNGPFLSSETYRFANMFTFTGKMADDEYSRVIYPTITSYNGSTTAFTNSDIVCAVPGSRPIYVLNAQSLVSAMRTNGNKMKPIDLNDYSEGGLIEYMQAMDALAAFDFNSYFDNGNGYNDCVDAMESAVRAANNADTTDDDSAEYASLRAAMDAKMTAYNKGVNDGYTDGSYATLKEAYEYAMQLMLDVQTQGYTDPTAAQEAADALNAVVLETNVERVDTAALESAIDAFESYQNIFTDDTYYYALGEVEAAKTAVWGAVDRYKDAASALELSDENTQTVANYTADITSATTALRINPDASVITNYGRYSINSAIALMQEVESHKDDYANFASFQTAVNAASAYAAALPTTDLTDYTAQRAEYIAQIEAVVAAYEALEYSFTKMPDNTIAKAGSTTSITTLESQDQGIQRVDFSYPTNAVVFKTSHGASTIKYGDALVTFSTNIVDLHNNALDSISINATAPQIEDSKRHLIESGAFTGTPPALSDEQKQTYAGCLEYNEFSLTNLRYAGSMSNVPDYILTLNDGTVVNDISVVEQTDLTPIIGVTDGSSTFPVHGALFANSDNASDTNLAEVSVSADMNVSVAGSPAVELTASTVPTLSSYTMTGTYFGAVTSYHVQNFAEFAGYNWFTSQTNNQFIYSNVQVIDISYLVDLVNQCSALLDNSEMYTTDSWSNFVTRLEEAQANLNYSSLSATTITNRCVTRYNNLWNAYQALEIKSNPVTFNYKDANGDDASTVINVQYGKTINDYAEEFNAIDYAETYQSADGAYTYTATQWSPEIDIYAQVNAAATYTMQYESKLNDADFTAYNNACAELLGALVDETYSAADLQKIDDAIDEMTYYYMSEEDREPLMGDVQAAINAETDELIALKESLTPSTVDIDAAKAAAEEAKAGKDEDVYDLSSLDFKYTTTVSVGGKDVAGITFESQGEVDDAIAEFLNNMNKREYTIYLNGSPVGTAEYGTPVIVGSDGAFGSNVEDVDSTDYDGENFVAWSYSYAAPSRDNQQTAPKYVITAKALGFVVKGDTYLETDNATENEQGYVVKFMTDDGKIFDIQYTTDGSVTVPTAPNYAFYTFTGYEGGYTAGDEITVSENTTIVANYNPETATTYTITSYPSKANWVEVTSATTETYAYNELVELQKDGAYCWVAGYTSDASGWAYDYVILSYGESYSFYACQSYTDDFDNGTYAGILPLTRSEFEDLTTSTSETVTGYLFDGAGNRVQADYDDFANPIYPTVATVSVLENIVPIYGEDNKLDKFSMIGTFTIPEDYTIVECGILFSSDQSADLAVTNVGNDGVARMKSSSYTCGNQFVINVKAPSSGEAVSFKYCAYAIVEDADGNLVTIYSKPIMGTTEGL